MYELIYIYNYAYNINFKIDQFRDWFILLEECY